MSSTPMTLQSSELAFHTPWGVLQIYNVYCLCLALLLLILPATIPSFQSLRFYNPVLFNSLLISYVAYCCLRMVSTKLMVPEFRWQVALHIIIDIAILTLLMHASGMRNAFGILINAAIASGSLLTAGRTSLFFASIATFSVLIEQHFAGAHTEIAAGGFANAGILSATFFATAILGYGLSRRIRVSEKIATQRGEDIQKLAQLNDYIIHHLDAGAMVVDHHHRVHLFNSAARQMLGVPENVTPGNFNQLSDNLSAQWWRWRETHFNQDTPFQPLPGGPEVIAHFQAIDDDPEGATLIILENIGKTMQQAQQLKLASLGRFTASIAHEVRNPIGAISHAAQLLQESETISDDDTRLVNIITQQTHKVNRLVKNILQLSRQKQAVQQTVVLDMWLKEFVDGLYLPELGEVEIQCSVDPENLKINFDPEQLQQILMNLAVNGLRYSKLQTDVASLTVVAGVLADQQAFVDVIDDGAGVAPDDIAKIFEPFFTTDRKGTGLGLYIAKELCEINQARLEYFRLNNQSCFRITFAKWIEGSGNNVK